VPETYSAGKVPETYSVRRGEGAETYSVRGRCGEGARDIFGARGKVPETYSVRAGKVPETYSVRRGRCQRHIQSGARGKVRAGKVRGKVPESYLEGKVPESYLEQLFLLIAETEVCHDRFASFPRMPS